jgi:hypothetical protein
LPGKPAVTGYDRLPPGMACVVVCSRLADDASNKQRGTDDEPWEWCWGRVYGRDGTHLCETRRSGERD